MGSVNARYDNEAEQLVLVHGEYTSPGPIGEWLRDLEAVEGLAHVLLWRIAACWPW